MAQLSAPVVDLSGLAKKSDLPDLTPYAKKTELPDVSPYALKTDVSSIITLKYVNSGNPQTLTQLLANYPASASLVNYYARVTDLYGTIDEVLRCRNANGVYRWVPQRESGSGIYTASSGSIPITPLFTPQTIRVTATTLTGNLNIIPSSVNAYFGEKHKIIMPQTLLVGGYLAQITTLVGSNITLLGGSKPEIEFGSDGWFQSG